MKNPLKLIFSFAVIVLSFLFSLGNLGEAYAATKTYGFSSPNKDYLYSQSAEWWKGVGDGTAKNGSAIVSFATLASVINNKKITPAAIAKLAYEKGYWNLSGATPTDLIEKLLGEYSNVEKVIAAGSKTSQRVSATAKTFTKMKNAAIIVRATGKKPFDTGETGGHYIVILAYKSNGKVLAFDPAQNKSTWIKASTLYGKMSKDIMFYAVTFSGEGDNLAQFAPSNLPVDDDDGDTGIEPEGDPDEPFDDEEEEQQPENYSTTGSDILIIGDSMIYRSNSTKKTVKTNLSWYKKYYNGKILSANANLKQARIISGDSKTFGDGISYIKNTLKAADVRANVVIDLGNNDCVSISSVLCPHGASVSSSQVKEMVQAIRAKNSTAKIYFTTNYRAVVEPSSTSDYSKLEEINRDVFVEATKSFTDVYLIDWVTAVKAQSSPSYYVHVEGHPTIAGSTALGNLIANAVINANNQGTGGSDGGSGDDSGTGGESGDAVDCETNPTDPSCTSDGDDGGSDEQGGQQQGTVVTTYGQVIAENALEVTWPAEDGTCKGTNGTTYSWLTMRDYCKSSINDEYAARLSGAGINPSVETAQNPASFIAAVIAASSNLGRIPETVLNGTTSLYDYFEAEAKKTDADWEKGNGVPAIGDVVYQNNQFYIYVGDARIMYGNAVTVKAGEWVPYMDNISSNQSYNYYRVTKKYMGGDQGGLDDQVPPEDQSEGEDAAGDGTPGEKIAARAMSFSWPLTKYSTDNAEVYGKCVAKYTSRYTSSSEINLFNLSTYPSETTKSWKLKTYPTGTKCNKTITPAYAKFKGVDGNISKMNSYSVGSMSFIRNVFLSLGVDINYLSISDLRSKLETSSNWELVTKNATAETEFVLGDLIVAPDAAMIYVGEFGGIYGKVAQAYKGSWSPRVTPLYLPKGKKTYVFRLKTDANISESGDCPEVSLDSVEGNEKIAVAASEMAWPYRTGSGDKLGKCLNSSNALVTFPEKLTYSVANNKLTTKSKSASTLAKERKKTGCLTTSRELYSSTLNEYLGLNAKSDIAFVYAALRKAGVKRFESGAALDLLSVQTAFNNLKNSSDFTLVTKKLTSKTSLQRGDIIIASQTKGKKTYSKIMLYIGAYGKTCTGLKYGSVVDLDNGSSTPYVRPIYYYLNNSSKYMRFYVYRANPSAYEDPEVAEDPGEDPGTPEDPETPSSSKGEKIAEQALKFSWPYTEYSIPTSSAWGKCVYWWGTKKNELVNYPRPFANGKFSDQTNEWSNGVVKLKSPNNYYYTCANTIPPYYAKYKNLSSWSINDIRDPEGEYNANIILKEKERSVMFTKPSQIENGWDCISFVNDTLKAASVTKFPSGIKSTVNASPSGWTKIGDYVLDTKTARSAYKKSSTLTAVDGTTKKETKLEPGDVVVRYDTYESKCSGCVKTMTKNGEQWVKGVHIFIWVGQKGWPYGDRAEGAKGWYSGGLVMDTWIGDHIYNYGNVKVFRYTGA